MTYEINAPKPVAVVQLAPPYPTSALSELQKISQLDETDEYGAILTLPSDTAARLSRQRRYRSCHHQFGSA